MPDEDNVISLPDNLITPADQARLESFAGHEISRGRLTRFTRHHDSNGDPVFDLFRGGPKANKLLARVGHDRSEGEFYMQSLSGSTVTTGTLPHIMAVLDEHLAQDHGEA